MKKRKMAYCQQPVAESWGERTVRRAGLFMLPGEMTRFFSAEEQRPIWTEPPEDKSGRFPEMGKGHTVLQGVGGGVVGLSHPALKPGWPFVA